MPCNHNKKFGNSVWGCPSHVHFPRRILVYALSCNSHTWLPDSTVQLNLAASPLIPVAFRVEALDWFAHTPVSRGSAAAYLVLVKKHGSILEFHSPAHTGSSSNMACPMLLTGRYPPTFISRYDQIGPASRSSSASSALGSYAGQCCVGAASISSQTQRIRKRAVRRVPRVRTQYAAGRSPVHGSF
jgi:hypothetical protein